jgi:uncharacterized protein involved in exopolysaccharide biosynthesis
MAGTNQDMDTDFVAAKGKVSEASMEYIRKLRDVRFYETIAELVSKQFEAAKMDEARQGSIIQVADVALTPDRKSSPKRAITILLATILGLFAACAWCILIEQFSRMNNNPDDRQRLSALRAMFR